jgi:hypothetical protein
MVQDKQNIVLKHEQETMVALSTGDIIPGLGCPLAVEINIPP